MKNEQGYSSLLWYLLIPDLISIIKETDPSNLDQLTKRIKDDIPQWKLPRILHEQIINCVE